MSHPVYTFKTTENVGVIVDALHKVTHNGFAIVEDGDVRSPVKLRVGRGREKFHACTAD